MRIILLLFLATLSFSYKIEAKYKANYGWFGTVAISKGILEKDKTHYKIITITKAKGIAATLSGHLIQTHISEGIVKNGRFIPLKYIVDIKRKGNDYYRVYIFDHKNKTVIKKRYKNGKLTKEYKYYYAPDDILTLYWNLPLYLKEKKSFYIFYAVGGRKKDGRVDVSFPTKEEIKQLKKELFNKKGIFLKANLYNKVFVGDKGILYLVINPKNWVTLAGEVKNVLKIGDLKGKLVNFKQKN